MCHFKVRDVTWPSCQHGDIHYNLSFIKKGVRQSSWSFMTLIFQTSHAILRTVHFHPFKITHTLLSIFRFYFCGPSKFVFGPITFVDRALYVVLDRRFFPRTSTFTSTRPFYLRGPSILLWNHVTIVRGLTKCEIVTNFRFLDFGAFLKGKFALNSFGHESRFLIEDQNGPQLIKWNINHFSTPNESQWTTHMSHNLWLIKQSI